MDVDEFIADPICTTDHSEKSGRLKTMFDPLTSYESVVTSEASASINETTALPSSYAEGRSVVISVLNRLEIFCADDPLSSVSMLRLTKCTTQEPSSDLNRFTKTSGDSPGPLPEPV